MGTIVTVRKAHLWLASGVLGLALGAAAALWDLVMLAVVAGACAMVAGVAAYRLVGLYTQRSAEVETLNDQVSELELSVRREAEARAQAEAELDSAAFAAQVDRTAVRRAPDPDSLTDAETGLFSESYFLIAADARIAAARRHLRPIAIVLLEVVEGLGSELPHPADACSVATGIKGTLRDADTACRLEAGAFALLLEDTPENGAIWTIERLRRAMAGSNPGLTIWAGIACYPAHGFNTNELLDRAESALSHAKEWRQDRIEIATAD
jgi:diguanylate cyclase (GGDEF)-like protein